MLVRIITIMVGSGPHQTSPHHAESANIHQQGELHDLEHGNNMDNQQEGNFRRSIQVEVAIDEGVI